jgi:hypothetical protein
MFHLKIFTPEALNRQAKARWNATTREADSETDMELANLLAEDDDLDFMDEPTMEKPMLEEKQDAPDSVVTMNIPSFPAEHIPSMAQDEDSISTFHPGRVVNLTEENELAKAATQERMLNQTPPAGIFKTSKQQESDGMSKMSMSDSASRISSLETELSSMHKNFKGAIEQLQSQAQDHAIAQVHQSSLLEEIIRMLRQNNISAPNITIPSSTNPSNMSKAANHPQTSTAGDSTGVAGHG